MDNTRQAAERYVNRVVESLLKPARTTPLTRENRALWPSKPGVYALYQQKKLLWVGETGCLKERAKDLFRTKNHTFRRRLGQKLFSGRRDFFPATSKTSFSNRIEHELTRFMEYHLSFVIISDAIGRKEIEERTCARSPGLLNMRHQRGRKA